MEVSSGQDLDSSDGRIVSVVLPVLNKERQIEHLLNQLRRQVPPPGGFEVIVVDGGSTDRTRDVVRSLAKQWNLVRLLENPRKLSSAGRNLGFQSASGKYVLFIDGHCSIPREDYLKRMVEIFELSRAECLCRPQPLKRLAKGAWGKAIASARHSHLGHYPGSDIYARSTGYSDPRSAGAAYVREVLEELGGYDERFDACEDVEFNHRVAKAGLRSYCHPDLTIHYWPRTSLVGLFRQMARYGRGRARLMARHPSTAPWPLLVPTGVIPICVGLGLAVGGKEVSYVAGFLGGLWLVLILVESFRLGGFSLAAARIAAAFLTIHIGLIAGFWAGLVEFGRFRHAGPDRRHATVQ